MRRLEELLRQMCQAAKAIGNTELENKFAEGLFCYFLTFSLLDRPKLAPLLFYFVIARRFYSSRESLRVGKG